MGIATDIAMGMVVLVPTRLLVLTKVLIPTRLRPARLLVLTKVLIPTRLLVLTKVLVPTRLLVLTKVLIPTRLLVPTKVLIPTRLLVPTKVLAAIRDRAVRTIQSAFLTGASRAERLTRTATVRDHVSHCQELILHSEIVDVPGFKGCSQHQPELRLGVRRVLRRASSN